MERTYDHFHYKAEVLWEAGFECKPDSAVAAQVLSTLSTALWRHSGLNEPRSAACSESEQAAGM